MLVFYLQKIFNCCQSIAAAHNRYFLSNFNRRSRTIHGLHSLWRIDRPVWARQSSRTFIVDQTNGWTFSSGDHWNCLSSSQTLGGISSISGGSRRLPAVQRDSRGRLRDALYTEKQHCFSLEIRHHGLSIGANWLRDKWEKTSGRLWLLFRTSDSTSVDPVALDSASDVVAYRILNARISSQYKLYLFASRSAITVESDSKVIAGTSNHERETITLECNLLLLSESSKLLYNCCNVRVKR